MLSVLSTSCLEAVVTLDSSLSYMRARFISPNYSFNQFLFQKSLVAGGSFLLSDLRLVFSSYTAWQSTVSLLFTFSTVSHTFPITGKWAASCSLDIHFVSQNVYLWPSCLCHTYPFLLQRTQTSRSISKSPSPWKNLHAFPIRRDNVYLQCPEAHFYFDCTFHHILSFAIITCLLFPSPFSEHKILEDTVSTSPTISLLNCYFVSWSLVLGQAALAPPGSFLEIQNLGPYRVRTWNLTRSPGDPYALNQAHTSCSFNTWLVELARKIKVPKIKHNLHNSFKGNCEWIMPLSHKIILKW